MKLAILIAVASVLTINNCAAKPTDDKYTTKYDDTDVDKILNSKRLLNNYVNCLLDKGPCNPDGAELKKNLREALEEDCKKCNEKQAQRAYQVIVHLHEKEPELLKQLKAKYDPNADFEKRLCKKIDAGEIETHHKCSAK